MKYDWCMLVERCPNEIRANGLPVVLRGDAAEKSRRSSHDREVVGSNLVGSTFQKPQLSTLPRPLN